MIRLNRLQVWWNAAEGALARVTLPRTDVTRVDDDVETLVRESTIGQACGALASLTARAWADSRSRRAAHAIVEAATPLPFVARVRLAGCAASVAAITAVALQAIKPAPAGAAGLIVPALVAAGGAVAFAAAAPLARAFADKPR